MAGRIALPDTAFSHQPTAEMLRQLLLHDPATGKLFWRERRLSMFKTQRDCNAFNTAYAGKEAFTSTRSDGYRVGAIFGKPYRAHRVIWAIHYGEWPQSEIDHIDGDPGNNRISNLRDVATATNRRNSKMLSNNKSGVNGVTWYKQTRKWVAHIKLDGKHRHLGYFTDINDAIAARKAAQNGHGFTVRHGMEDS